MRLELPNYTDDTLLDLLANDDKDAFTMLYRRYWEILFTAAAKALRSKLDAADIVQEVFLSLWNRRHQLNIEGSLSAYLHTSIRYKAIHYIEKNITRRDYLAILTEIEEDCLPATGEIRLQVKEVRELVHNTVTKMPPKMQEVYKLSRQEHLSHKEIAGRLGISGETVKKHVQHALALIKTALDRGSVPIPLLVFAILS